MKLYHIGPHPPKPYPLDSYLKREWRKWQNLPVKGVFMTSDYLQVASNHGIIGNVYVYKLDEKYIKEAGGLRKYDNAQEIVIPEDLFYNMKFLGKKIDEKTLLDELRDYDKGWRGFYTKYRELPKEINNTLESYLRHWKNDINSHKLTISSIKYIIPKLYRLYWELKDKKKKGLIIELIKSLKNEQQILQNDIERLIDELNQVKDKYGKHSDKAKMWHHKIDSIYGDIFDVEK